MYLSPRTGNTTAPGTESFCNDTAGREWNLYFPQVIRLLLLTKASMIA